MEMVRQVLLEYMEKTFLFQFDSEITESSDLFKAGIIDSYGYIKLMTFVQKTFAIEFSRSELLTNVIASLSSMVAVVEAKLEERAKVLTVAEEHV
jgi:acyl carrier protein